MAAQEIEAMHMGGGTREMPRGLRRILTRPRVAPRGGRRAERPRGEALEGRRLLTGEPRFITPLAGVPYRDWTIAAYFDHDPSSPWTYDYKYGGVTYDGHDGVDFSVANFAAMDAGVPVFAAADGTVVAANDGEFDRSTSWDNPHPANYVIVDHGGGWRTLYYHLRKDSVAVRVGQAVAAGAVLGLVGSSGISSGAHLHFEVRRDGVAVDPFLAPGSLWADSIPYAGSVRGFLDYGLTDHVPESLKERPVEIDVFSPASGQSICFWLRTINARSGDVARIRWYTPTGDLFKTYEGVVQNDYQLGQTWSSILLPESPPLGTWTVEFDLNGGSPFRRTFEVSESARPILQVSEFGTRRSGLPDIPGDPFVLRLSPPGESTTQSFTVRNAGNAPLSVRDLDLPPWLHLVEGLGPTLGPGASDTFTVRLGPTWPSAAGEIVIDTTDPEIPRFRIPIEGPAGIYREGDYDGDGLADPAVFEPSTSTFYIAASARGPRALQFGIGTLHGGSPVPATGDYDGDGLGDPAVFEPSTSTFYLARSKLGNVARQFGIGALFGGAPVVVPGDYDGDRIADPAVFEPSTSTFYLARSSLGNVARQFGIGTLYGGAPTPVPADYDGDGVTDPAVFEPSTSTFYLALSSRGNRAVQFGIGRRFGGDPSAWPADYDGDGVTDPAVFEPSTSTFYLARSSLGNVARQIGVGSRLGGVPVPSPGDYDGDGLADPAVFDRSTATFTVGRPASPPATRQFGIGANQGGEPIVVPADYDGDGVTDLAVFEPSTSTFYLSRSRAGNLAFQFGIGTSHGGHPIPLSSSNIRRTRR